MSIKIKIRQIEVNELLNDARISKDVVTLIRKFKNFEKDVGRVVEVQFGIPAREENSEFESVYSRVFLKKQFSNIEELEEYLEHNLIHPPSRGEGGIATDGNNFAYNFESLFVEFLQE